jgi:hypothetical protein
VRVARTVHSERLEDAIFKQLLVGVTGNLLDNRPQNKVAGVAVFEFCSGFEVQITAAILLNEFADTVVHAAGSAIQESGESNEIGNAGGVRQKFADSDAFPRVPAVVGEIVRDVPIEPQLAFIHELQHQQCGKLLRHRPNFELRLQIVGNVPFAIGKAEGALIQDFALTGDEDAAVEVSGGEVSLHELVDLSRYGRLGVR